MTILNPIEATLKFVYGILAADLAPRRISVTHCSFIMCLMATSRAQRPVYTNATRAFAVSCAITSKA